MMETALLPAAYFDALYARDPDPWRFATSDYERAKYRATLAALPGPLLGAALEVGCSIGVLTRHCPALYLAAGGRRGRSGTCRSPAALRHLAPGDDPVPAHSTRMAGGPVRPDPILENALFPVAH
jgi:hypothetical protein